MGMILSLAVSFRADGVPRIICIAPLFPPSTTMLTHFVSIRGHSQGIGASTSDSSLHNELQGETMTMNTAKPMKPVQPRTATAWVRIPDGHEGQHRHEGHVGFIDGLTEIVTDPTGIRTGKNHIV